MVKKKATNQPTTEEQKDRPGICEKCGSGKFQLRIVNKQMIRRCKQCGDEMAV